MSRYTIAVDNGATGSVAILGPDGPFFEPVPTKDQLMGKAGKVAKRIDHAALSKLIDARVFASPALCRAFIERPFTGGPMFINVSVLSARSHEAVSIVLEQLGIGYETVDSKPWQAAMLGAVKGSAELKKASKLRGAQMYPALAATINDHGDADALLMAHHYHHAK
jgi:hypothetical protein